MSKRKSLISKIVVSLLILIMIPIAIFASNLPKANLKNTVQFLVQDIEGFFCYGIVGSAIKTEGGTTTGVTDPYNCTKNTNDIVFNSPFFSSSLSGDGTKIILNSQGSPIDDDDELTIDDQSILFDVSDLDNKKDSISYFFVFLNSAEEDASIVDDDRSVKVNVNEEWFDKDKNRLASPSNLTTTWSYSVLTKTNDNTTFNFPTTWISNTAGNTDYKLGAGVDVPPKNDGNYSYILIEYNLKVNDNYISFNEQFTLTINFRSNALD